MSITFNPRNLPAHGAVILLGGLVILGIASTSLADTYSLYGTSLPVDSIVGVDSSSVKISVGGETRILPKTEQNFFILGRVIQDHNASKVLGSAQLANITEQGMRAGDFRTSALAFSFLLNRAEGLDALVEGVIINVARLPKFSDFVIEVLSKNGSIINLSGVARLVSEVAPPDLDKLLPAGAPFFAEHEAALNELFHRRYLELVSTRAYDAAERTWLIASKIFKNGLESLARERSLVTETLLATRNLDSARLVELRHDPLFVSVPALRSVLSDGLHELARQALNKGRFRDVLQVLSVIDVNQVTPATHEIAAEAIEKGAAEGITVNELLSDLPVALMLRGLAQSNQKLATKYLQILEESVGHGQADVADPVYSEILKIRPDPNVANDNLRYSLAVRALWHGDRGSARQLIQTRSSKLGVFKRLQLFALGYFISVFVLYPALLVIALVSGLAVLRARAQKIEQDKETARRVVERTSGFKGGGELGGSENRLEYLGLLREFGLVPEATLREIKAMYRSKVKVHHPDTAGVEHASDDFLQMNEKYERLLELYEILNGTQN